MNHIMKPVDAMRLRGRVTITIAAFTDAPNVDGGYTATGKAVVCDWWPFAWPLVIEKIKTTMCYRFNEPVTGAFLFSASGNSVAQAVQNARYLWMNRKGVSANCLSRTIFCDWIDRDDIKRGDK